MIARGDMGVEIPLEQVPVVQKLFIRRCNEVGKPVIIATQMLETMQVNPRPTRAEVSDVANGVYDKTSCIMLSGECAVGKHPIICVQTMDKIAKNIEGAIHYWKRFNSTVHLNRTEDPARNVANTTAKTAEYVRPDAIVAYAHTARTVKMLAGTGVPCPIFAIADMKSSYYQLAAAWNITPILVEGEDSVENTVSKGIEILKQKGMLETGDTVVLTGGGKTLYNNKESQIVGATMKI